MSLTDEQRALRDAVRALLARQQRRPPARDGEACANSYDQGGHDQEGYDQEGYDQSLWQRLCGEIGVAGLSVPECYGGAGAGPVETHIAAEELGRDLTPSPMIGSAVLAAQALLASGDDAACRRLLPPIADGTTIAALAWTGPDGHWDPGEAACHAAAEATTAARPATWVHSGWVLNGTAHHVLDGAAADVLLVAARMPDGVGLFDVDPRHTGVTRSAATTMDGTRELAIVELENVPGRRVGDRAALARVRDLACIALSAEQVGAAQRALELTVAYTQIRVQFGRAIGSFQALQHRMADLHVLVESARSLSYAAATAAAERAPDLGLRAAAAKVYC